MTNCVAAYNGLGLSAAGGFFDSLVCRSNTSVGASIGGSDETIVSHSDFSRNGSGNFQGQGDNGIAFHSGLIIACTMTNNNGHGLRRSGNWNGTQVVRDCYSAYNSGIGVEGQIMSNSVVIGNGNGFFSYGARPVVLNSVIRDNVNGIGVAFAGWFGPIGECRGNIIVGNQQGIYFDSNTSGQNVTNISGNKITGNSAYEVYNDGTAAIIATNNYWGEPTTTELTNNVRDLTKIYDSQDNASVGQVILKPYLTNDPFAKPPILDTNTPADVSPSKVEAPLSPSPPALCPSLINGAKARATSLAKPTPFSP